LTLSQQRRYIFAAMDETLLQKRQRRDRRKYNRLRSWLMKKPRPMSVAEFAELVGVTPSYVSQLTSDDPPWPSRDVARRIALVTKGAVTPNDLAGYAAKAEVDEEAAA
jgi:transcriptional regulator with XRE-family HTH domain